jgi:putative colanic acid biosynthesis acetyltransferase WcaF
MSLVTAPIAVADQAWVCAGAFVAPGTTVAQGAVVGAHAVVTRDVPAWVVVAGNPAVKVTDRRLRADSNSVTHETDASR